MVEPFLVIPITINCLVNQPGSGAVHNLGHVVKPLELGLVHLDRCGFDGHGVALPDVFIKQNPCIYCIDS